MPTVGEQFRHAREAQHLDVYQMAEITKIKTDHIRALEAGQFEVFVAPVYIRGFARNYAKALKLDEARLMSDLDQELSGDARFREPPRLSKEPRSPLDFIALQVSRLNWRVALVLAAVVVLLVLLVGALRMRSHRADDPLRNLGPGIYQSKDEATDETLPVPAPRK
jgi:cytoskeleton protein RodZ